MSEGHSVQTGFKIASNGVSTRANLDDDGNVQVVVMSGGGGGGGGACTIADAADTVEGALADAAIVTDAAGTVSGKLRGLVKIFADIWDSTNNFFRAGPKTATTTGTIAGVGQTVNASLNGKYASVSFQLLATGGPSGFLAVEVSVDSGTTYFAAECWNPAGSGTGPIISSNSIDVSVNTSGLWVVPLPPGTTNLRFRENSWVAGSWALSVAASTFPAMDWVRMGQPIISAPTNGGGAGQQMLVTKGGAATYLVDSTTGSAVTVNGSALADTFANPANVLEVQNFPYNYNGTTWDRLRGDTTNGLDVDVTRIGGTVATSIADVTGTPVTVNAPLGTASVALAGRQGCGVFIAGQTGDLRAVFTPYLSYDGGTTWQATQFLTDVATFAATLNTVGSSGPGGTDIAATISVLGGATHARVVATSYTFGTGVVTLRATQAVENCLQLVNQGTPAVITKSWYTKLSDATTGPVAVKPASTAAVATDIALVVAVSPNNIVPVSNSVLSVVGGGTEATAQRVTIANNSTGVLAVTNANLDVALSTRLKAADTLAAVTTVGTITNPVTVTGTVGITAAALPLPTGAATETTLATVAALSKAEDAAAVSGDTGVPILGVRQDILDGSPASDNGDYQTLLFDQMGRLRVSIDSNQLDTLISQSKITNALLRAVTIQLATMQGTAWTVDDYSLFSEPFLQ